MAGAWIYIAIFAATVLWAFAEVGINGWALVPRIIAPLIILIATFLVMPTLSTSPSRWKWPGAASLIVILATVTSGLAFSRINAPTASRPLPDPGSSMAGPARMQAGEDWPAYGGSDSARRSSPLAQITPANVGSLSPPRKP